MENRDDHAAFVGLTTAMENVTRERDEALAREEHLRNALHYAAVNNNAHRDIIAAHIAGYERAIEQYQQSIRESYDRMQTNVDAPRRSISDMRERVAALQRLDGELLRSEQKMCSCGENPADDQCDACEKRMCSVCLVSHVCEQGVQDV